MTQDMMTLRALLEKSSDADLLREMIGFTAAAADGTGGRGPDRRRSRRALGGSYHPPQRLPDRSWETRVATVDEDPEAEEGDYFPGFLEPRRMAEKALAAVIAGGLHPGRVTRLSTICFMDSTDVWAPPRAFPCLNESRGIHRPSIL